MDLNSVHESLTARKRELLDRQKRLARHTRHREEPLSPDFAEQAVELENQDVLNALDKEATAELRAIERALVRLTEEGYQLCSACGDDIEEARLLALPYVDLCIQCATAREQKS